MQFARCVPRGYPGTAVAEDVGEIGMVRAGFLSGLIFYAHARLKRCTDKLNSPRLQNVLKLIDSRCSSGVHGALVQRSKQCAQRLFR